MRTYSLATLLLGFALAQFFLTPRPDAVAQTAGEDRYAAESYQGAGGLSPLSEATASEPVPMTGQSPALSQGGFPPNDVGRSIASPSTDAPFETAEELLPQRANTGPASIPSDLQEPDAATTPMQGAAAVEIGRTASPTTAKEWLVEFTASAATDGLAGEPLTLAKAMEGQVGRQRLLEVVTAYWKLAVAAGKYHAVQQGLRSHSSGGMRGSHAQLEAQAAAMELAAVRAQHRLAQILKWPEGKLPLPTNEPHAGTYNTRYDEIYSGRFSRRAWELDQTLPLLHQVMTARAAVLGRARPDSAEFAMAANEFLDVVGEYNLAIAEYALLAAGDSLGGRDLVPLLIRVERKENEVTGTPTVATGGRSQRRLASVPRGAGAPQRATAEDPTQQQIPQRSAPDDRWRTRGTATIEPR